MSSLKSSNQNQRISSTLLSCKDTVAQIKNIKVADNFNQCQLANFGKKHHSNEARVIASLATNERGFLSLGKTSIDISPIGIGTLQWGDPKCGFGNQFGERELAQAYTILREGGINFFDTAEVYGYQNIKEGLSAEQLLGRFSTTETPSDSLPAPVVATKFFTIPWTKLLIGGGWRLGRSSMVPALRESLQRMGRNEVDLWQIHFPFPTFSNQALMEGLKEALDLGLTKAVGVSNFNRQQMEEAHRILESYNIPLASNQVRYNLLNRDPETSSLLQSSKDLGITLIAYSPLATGLLTDKALGKNTSEASKVQPLLKLMASIGSQHGGKSVTQVALNYLICKGAIPIAGCKSPEQARSHVAVLGWKLDDDEVASLEGKAKALDL